MIRFSLVRPGEVTQLTAVNDDVLAGIRLGDQEEFWYQSSGGAKVQGWLVKPPNFDPNKKYPLILEIHGGPHGAYNVAFSYMNQNFAANGNLVLYTNPRGSTGYGTGFGNAIERAYPSVDYDDLIAAVDTVVGRGIVDESRMYVGGCSGGGVLSSWVIGHTTRFAAAAVRCPVIDWLSFSGQTDIPLFTGNFFDKPFWEDPEAVARQSSLMYVKNVKTPTLLMTGQLDMRTPMPQTEEYYAALKMLGVPARFFSSPASITAPRRSPRTSCGPCFTCRAGTRSGAARTAPPRCRDGGPRRSRRAAPRQVGAPPPRGCRGARRGAGLRRRRRWLHRKRL
ncbi:MAG: prolyl oligopeptidase family serine peptidase [Gemmatimonadales bacterium]